MIGKWDSRFLDMAKLVSTWSKDPSTQVGAVIVDNDNRVLSVGYNGFAKCVDDSPERLEDRNTKLKGTIHAETNAILFANCSLKGSILYTYPFMPCSNCAANIIQVGIKRVFTLQADPERAERWKTEFDLARTFLKEAGVDLIEY